MADRDKLLEIGAIRVCSDCDFETMERKAMREHSMRVHNVRHGRTQDRSMQKEVKHYSDEEKYMRVIDKK